MNSMLNKLTKFHLFIKLFDYKLDSKTIFDRTLIKKQLLFCDSLYRFYQVRGKKAANGL